MGSQRALNSKENPPSQAVEASTEQKSLWPYGVEGSFVLTTAVAAFLIFWSYTFILHAVGWDTPVYASYLEYAWRMGFPAGVVWSLNPAWVGPFTLLWLPLRVTGLSSESVFIVAPWILLVMYAASTWLFVKSTTGDRELAILSMVFVPLSFFSLRLALDLLRNLFSMTLLLLFLALAISWEKTGGIRKLVAAAIISWLLIYIYFPAWLILAGVLIVYAVFSFLETRQMSRNGGLLLLVMGPPMFLLVMIILLGPASFPSLNIASLVKTTSGTPSLNPGSLLGLTISRFTQENIVFVVAAVSIAVITFLRPLSGGRRSRYGQPFLILMRSWLLTILLALAAISILSASRIPVFSDIVERILLYLPMPGLLALGLEELHAHRITLPKLFHLSSISASASRTWHKHSRTITVLLYILLIGMAFIHTANTRVTFYPSKDEVATLKWIHNNYGVNILIVARIPNGTLNWLPLIIGWRASSPYDSLYFGTIQALLQGQPSSDFNSLSYTTGELSQLKVFVLDEWYHVDPSDYSHLSELSGSPLRLFLVLT